MRSGERAWTKGQKGEFLLLPNPISQLSLDLHHLTFVQPDPLLSTDRTVVSALGRAQLIWTKGPRPDKTCRHPPPDFD